VIETFRRHRGPLTLVGLLAVATAIYWISAHKFDAGRRLRALRAVPGDRAHASRRVLGPETVTAWQPLVNAVLAAAGLGLCWWMLARIGVASPRSPASDRL
jgi:hypothetical protein